MRPTESVRYSAYLKRPTNQYRKGKSTSAFRNLMLESNVLAIDVLSSIDDLEYTSVIQALKEFEYRVCDTLDVKDRFQPTPIRIADDDDMHIRFDDEDIPRALHQLKKMYPEQYYQFEDAVYSLFPDFSSIDIQAHELNLGERKSLRLVYSNAIDQKMIIYRKMIIFRLYHFTSKIRYIELLFSVMRLINRLVLLLCPPEPREYFGC